MAQRSNVYRLAAQSDVGALRSLLAEAALAWLQVNSDQVGVQSYQQIAEQLGQLDPAAAISYTNQVPPDAREAWISTVARGYARVDPQAAMDWISQYRGDPIYEAGMMAIIQQSAQYDPESAAQLLASVDTTLQAAQPVIQMVARQWAWQDPAAARGWVLSLEAGESRDRALGAYVQGAAAGELRHFARRRHQRPLA